MPQFFLFATPLLQLVRRALLHCCTSMFLPRQFYAVSRVALPDFLLLLLMELRPSVITRHPKCTNLSVSKVPCGSLLSEIDFLRAEGSIPFRTHNSESIRPYLPASNISINFMRHS